MKNIIPLILAVVFISVSCSDDLKINGVHAYPEEITLLEGDSTRIMATIDFEGGKYNEPGLIQLQWSSDNEGVATVDTSGMVRTHAIGNANIMVSCADKISQCAVTVIEDTTTTATPEEELPAQ